MSVPMGRLFRSAERVFVMVALLLSSGAFLLILEPEANLQPAEGSAVLRMIWLVVYAVAALLAAPRWKQVVRTVARDKILLLLVIYVLLSVFWSTAPDVTIRRSIALVGTTLLGVLLATRYTLEDQVRIVAGVLAVTIVLSFIVAFTAPDLGIMTGLHEGAWRGIFSHKNVLGRTTALAAIVLALLRGRTRMSRGAVWLTLLASVALLFLSTSKTAIVALLSLGALLIFFRTQRWSVNARMAVMAAGVMATASVAVLVIENFAAILALLGRDATLTGRTIMWVSAVEMIGRHPYLGYGYSSFWLGEASSAAVIWQAVGWEPGHAHNGLIDLTLDLGLLGLGLFLLHFFLSFRRATMLMRRVRTGAGLWPVMFLAYMFLYNLTESAILKQNHLSWILYVAVALSLRLHGARHAKTTLTPSDIAPVRTAA